MPRKNRRPPKDRVAALACRALVRHCNHAHVPEGRLMAAVIEQALRDALDKEHSVGAARFIQGDDLIPFADAAGVEPEYVRDVFTRAIGYAARESW